MVKVNIVFLNFLQLACRNQSVYKQCVELVCRIEIIGLALVGSIGDVFLCQFLDGSEDVENCLLRLLQAANGDVKLAEKGILFIDEIDKIGRKGESPSITRDVSGEGVQQP